MIYIKINISNICNVHPEYPSATTSTIIVDLNFQFSRANPDVKFPPD